MYHVIRLSLLVTLSLIFQKKAVAQTTPPCSVPPPAGAEACNTTCVYCDFNGYMGTNAGTASGGNTVCGEIALHNDQWFGFVAGTDCITINVATSNCANGNGLQAAFFNSCTSDAIVCNAGSGNGEGQPLELSYCGFEPGRTYYLMVDGWAGDVCNYTIEVLSGSITPPPPGLPQPISGPTEVCPGATVVYSIPEVDNAGHYHWTAPAGAKINGASNNLNVAAPGGHEVTITFGAGTGQVCVGAANACSPENKICLNVTNKPIAPTPKPKLEICFENRPYEWDEAPHTVLSTPGTYTLTSSPYTSYLGCDSTVRQTIVLKQQIKRNIGVQNVCEGTCLTINGNQYCQTGGPYFEAFESFQGCDSLVEFSVNVVSAVAMIAPTGGINCASPTLTLNATGSTSGSNTIYRWFSDTGPNPIGSGLTQSVSSGGTYTFVIINTVGSATCRDTATVAISQNTTTPGATASGGAISCTAPTVALQGNSGTSSVNYVWSGPGITPANKNQQNPTVAQPGTYTLVVTNPANSCTTSVTAEVLADTLRPTASATGGLLTCTAETLVLDGSSNTPGVAWRWVGPDIHIGNETLENPTVALPGTYSVTVTNAQNGCTATAVANVAKNVEKPIVSAGADKVINCYHTSVSLDGSGSPGSAQFLWSGPGIAPAEQTLPNPQVGQPGTYTLTATNPINGCLQRDTVLVSADLTPPLADAGPDTIINCYHPSIRLGGAASSQGPQFTATWSGAGIFSGNLNEYRPLVTQPDPQYTLTVLNTVNGCKTVDFVSVGVNVEPPTAATGPDQTLTCTQPNGIQLPGEGTPSGVVNFLWSGPGIGANNAAQQTPNITQPGDYTLTVTNPVNGCTATDAVTIFTDINLPAASAGQDWTLNCTIKSVALDGSTSATGPGITYLWAGPGITAANASEQSPANIGTPGTYTLSVTNAANNCTNTDIVVVLLDTLAPTADAGAARMLNCFNQQLDTLNASASSSGPKFAYRWQGPAINPATQSLQSPVVTLPGTYTLTVTNIENTCSATSQVVVNENIIEPVAHAGPDATIDCFTTSALLGGNASSGPQFRYAWSGPALDSLSRTLPQPTTTAPGTFTLVVTDTENGCTATDAVTVVSTAVYPTASAGADGLLTCAAPDFTLDGSASSGGANIQYTWAGPGITAATQAQQSPLTALPGVYILTVKNAANNCALSDTVQVSENKTAPEAITTMMLRLDCQTTSVVLDGSESSSGPGIQYLWSGPGITPTSASSQSPSVTQPGAYSLLVTDVANGCTATAATTVAQDTMPPSASAGPDQLLTCDITTVVLDGWASSSGTVFDYLWQGPGINTSNFAEQSPTVADSGLYLITVTNLGNHCTATDQVLVQENTEAPQAAAGPDRTITCAVATVMLDGSLSDVGPQFSYSWNGPGLNLTNSSTIQPITSEPGIYNLTVTNSDNGCTSVDAVSVTEDVAPPDANAGPDLSITCANAATGVTLSSAGSSSGPGYALHWSGPGITPANEGQPEPTVKLVGTYILQIQNLSNGCVNTDTANVLQDQNLPIANAGPNRTLSCSVTSVILDGSGSTDLGGGVNYTWAGPGITPANQSDERPSVGLPGTYTLSVTNALTGCSTASEVVVNTDTQPPVVSIQTDVLTCAEPLGDLSAVTLPATGCTYDWAGPDINSSNINSAAFQISVAGLYSVTVTGPNGCTATATATVSEDADFPSGSGEGTTLNCKNGGQSIISGQVNTTGATFEWHGPNGFTANTLEINVNQPGTYQLIITASNGCKRSIPVQVLSDYTAPTVLLSVGKKLTCAVTSVVIGTGGTSTGPHFSYSWSTLNGHIASGANSLSPNVDRAGYYTLMVTNLLNGCTGTATIAVENDPSVPTALGLAVRDVRCFGEKNGSIQIASVNGGTPPFVYSLNGSTASATDRFSPLAPGSYTLTLEDANGCLLDTTLLIAEPLPLTVSLGPDLDLQLGDSATVSAQITHSTPLAAVVWNFSENCPPPSAGFCTAFTYLPLDTYRHRLTVRDSNGCEASDELLLRLRKDHRVFVPNVLSPSSTDPDNFHLMVYGGSDVARVRQWQIFDRWGSTVFTAKDFQPNDPNFAWNGKIRGETATGAVYVWAAEIEFVDGTVEVLKGDVTVVR